MRSAFPINSHQNIRIVGNEEGIYVPIFAICPHGTINTGNIFISIVMRVWRWLEGTLIRVTAIFGYCAPAVLAKTKFLSDYRPLSLFVARPISVITDTRVVSNQPPTSKLWPIKECHTQKVGEQIEVSFFGVNAS